MLFCTPRDSPLRSLRPHPDNLNNESTFALNAMDRALWDTNLKSGINYLAPLERALQVKMRSILQTSFLISYTGTVQIWSVCVCGGVGVEGWGVGGSRSLVNESIGFHLGRLRTGESDARIMQNAKGKRNSPGTLHEWGELRVEKFCRRGERKSG